MQSIRTKIFSAFLIVIACLFALVIALVALHFSIVFKYQSVINNMAMEYKLITDSTNLVKYYNEYTKNPADSSKRTLYNTTHADIENAMKQLDEKIKSKESIVIFTGLKNSLRNVMTECDNGLLAQKEGRSEDLSTRFEKAYGKNEFVRDNTSKLILSELEYMKVLQKDINQTHTASIIFGSIILIVITQFCIFYAGTLSKKLVLPLQNLASLTKQIAQGDMNADVDEVLRKENDEVGSLANSFNAMIIALRDTIKKLTDSNTIIAEAQKGLEVKNNELERMNKLMVDRELRMIELKKENDKLKQELAQIKPPQQ